MNTYATTSVAGRTRSSSERKRLGQYFTGPRVARLLATLAQARRAKTILDPMMGSCDMLRGALAAGAEPEVLAGIDVDPLCIDLAADGSDLAGATLIHGDAFAPSTIQALPIGAWDLVITNPPYVRYQTTTSSDGMIPSADEVRRGLRQTVSENGQLADRGLLSSLVDNYSGLADLAVPAWLLCATLVARGGTLAMVVPETWLSRDYAVAVRYLLARCFEIEFVVRDADACWFTDALVRTSLIVARRVATKTSAFDSAGGDGYVEAIVERAAMDEASVVGRLYPRATYPDRAFLRELQDHRRSQPTRQALRHGSVSWVPAEHSNEELRALITTSRWARALEPTSPSAPASGAVIPIAVKGALGGQAPRVTTLSALGWRVGQGLRTGANSFFYCDLLEEGRDTSRVRMGAALGGVEVEVPTVALAPVLRSQSELSGAFSVALETLWGRVLLLHRYAVRDDLSQDEELTPYEALPEPLAAVVRLAAQTNVGSETVPRLISRLTAVRTNERTGSRNGIVRPATFWYQLPPMTPRHQPELLVARINHGHPRFIANPGAALVDANFSTLWRDGESGPADQSAMLALLNSSWTQAVLESSATVLGGGALKVEATQLRRLPVPVLPTPIWKGLSDLGRKLGTAPQSQRNALLHAIDDRILGDGLGLAEQVANAVSEAARLALSGRSA